MSEITVSEMRSAIQQILEDAITMYCGQMMCNVTLSRTPETEKIKALIGTVEADTPTTLTFDGWQLAELAALTLRTEGQQ